MKIGGDRMTIEFMRDLLSKDEKNSRIQNLPAWCSGRCV